MKLLSYVTFQCDTSFLTRFYGLRVTGWVNHAGTANLRVVFLPGIRSYLLC